MLFWYLSCLTLWVGQLDHNKDTKETKGLIYNQDAIIC